MENSQKVYRRAGAPAALTPRAITGHAGGRRTASDKRHSMPVVAFHRQDTKEGDTTKTQRHREKENKNAHHEGTKDTKKVSAREARKPKVLSVFVPSW